MKQSLILVLLFVSMFTVPCFANSQTTETVICFPEADAKKLLVEIEKRKLDQQLIEEQKKMISLLEEENAKLKEQIKLLKEVVELERTQKQMLKEELIEKRKSDFWTSVKSFVQGVVTGTAVAAILFAL